MARQRLVKPELFQHEDLHRAELVSRLPLRVAYIGLWTCCDRRGCFEWKPSRLKLNVLPFDDVDFGTVLDALEAHGFIRSYVVNGQRFGVVPTLPLHQSFHKQEKPNKLIPDPPPFGAASEPAPVHTGASTVQPPTRPHAAPEPAPVEHGATSASTALSTASSTGTVAVAGTALRASARDDVDDTATPDPFARDGAIWDAFQVEVSAQQRDELRRFFAQPGIQERAMHWVAWLNGTLEGLGMPGGKAASMADICLGLGEFLVSGTGDAKPVVMARFIDQARRRRLDTPPPELPAPSAGGSRLADDVPEFWRLLRTTGLHIVPARQREDRIREAVASGIIPDERWFRERWGVVHLAAKECVVGTEADVIRRLWKLLNDGKQVPYPSHVTEPHPWLDWPGRELPSPAGAAA